MSLLEDSTHYQTLKKDYGTPISLKARLNESRINSMHMQNGPLNYSYACSLLTERHIDMLQGLAEDQFVMKKYRLLQEGMLVNKSENSAVTHTRSRDPKACFYQAELHKIHTLCKAIEGRYKAVVQIGIGGSELGPKALYHALLPYAIEQKKNKVAVTFISNIDSDHVWQELHKNRWDETLFIIVSKSGTTTETRSNTRLIQALAAHHGVAQESFVQQCVAVTTPGSLLDSPTWAGKHVYIESGIGGRYSSTSAVGGLVLSLAFGHDYFLELLAGAHTMDCAAENPNCRENMSLLSALNTIYERNCLSFPGTAIIPYSSALRDFPAHLQQLICESNGKQVDIEGENLPYSTAGILFGAPGSNAQHSFFQMLHQGTDIIPMQFIGFLTPQMTLPVADLNPAHHTQIQANMLAQMVAFALGNTHSSTQYCPGNKPSTLVYAQKLTPHTVGALLAFYENATMFQSFLWGINAFDQPGVEEGKKLAEAVLKNRIDCPEALHAFQRLLQINKT